MNETLVRIEWPNACFCLVSVQGQVIAAAPLGKRWIGQRTKAAADWYKRKGATVLYARKPGEWKEYGVE